MRLLENIKSTYQSAANEENRTYMFNYMRQQFDYYGLKSPVRKTLSKPFLKTAKTLPKPEIIDLVKALWFEPQRECQYLAIDIAVPYFKKHPDVSDIDLFVDLAKTKPWWDTIDFIASKLMGNYFLAFPEQRDAYLEDWVNSGDKWLIRCAILFQLKYKTETDLQCLYKIILSTCHTNEFFINKAIGWVLRQQAKRIPDEILKFVEAHQSKLSDLSKREALKHFTNGLV